MENVNESRLKSSVFFVEATSTEQFYLWVENNKKMDWVQDSSGFSRHIGNINGDKHMPVVVNFNFAEIYGSRICFYEATSRYVDHTMVEDYIEKNYPVKYDGDSRLAMTDAMNFHHAIGLCLDLNEKIEKQQ